MPALNFNYANGVRVQLTEEQQKLIQKLYTDAAKDINKQLKKAPRVPSDTMRKEYLKKLQKQLDTALQGIQEEIQQSVEGSMKDVAKAVVKCNKDFLSSVGLPIEGALSHVPDQIVRTVATGQLYDGNWTLSRALWRSTKKAHDDINTIIAKGIAENKSAYDIAKDLEKYVKPSARKPWDWSKVYPGTSKKVDYNAQRLARTMVSHAYQYSFVQTTKDNPFVLDYTWLSAGSERTCDLCRERNGQHFAKKDLPLDHPNGMCTWLANSPSMMDISNRLADWANGKPDSEIDKWLEKVYGSKNKSIKDDFIPQTSKDITSRWGIPCTGIKGEAIQNLHKMLKFYSQELGIDVSKYLDSIDNKNPEHARGYAAYTYYSRTPSGYSLNLHVHKDYSSNLDYETWIHEFAHIINMRYSMKEYRGFPWKADDLADALIIDAFTSNGFPLSRSGLPIKKDVSREITPYGSTDSMEAIAEAALRKYALGASSPVLDSICNSLERWVKEINDTL